MPSYRVWLGKWSYCKVSYLGSRDTTQSKLTSQLTKQWGCSWTVKQDSYKIPTRVQFPTPLPNIESDIMEQKLITLECGHKIITVMDDLYTIGYNVLCMACFKNYSAYKQIVNILEKIDYPESL